MISEVAATRILIWCANIELILILLVIFPDLPSELVFSVVSGFLTPLVWAAVPAIIMFILGIAFDLLRDAFLLPQTQAVPADCSGEVSRSLSGRWEFSVHRVRVALSDLSLGAHVSGILQPKVMISGGLLYGILVNNWKSEAVVAHELGHIRNGDRWITGVISFTIVFSVLQVMDILFPQVLDHTRFAMSLRGISEDRAPGFLLGFSDGDPFPRSVRGLSIATHLYVLSCILHWREYAADFVAATIIGSKRKYLRFLDNLLTESQVITEARTFAHSLGGSFSHPSLDRRKRRIAKKASALGPNRILILLWGTVLAMGSLSIILMLDVASDMAFVQGVGVLWTLASLAVVGVVGLLVELAKYFTILTAASTASNSTSPWSNAR